MFRVAVILKGMMEDGQGLRQSCSNIHPIRYRGFRGVPAKIRSYRKLGNSRSAFATIAICQGITLNNVPLSMERTILFAASSTLRMKGMRKGLFAVIGVTI